MFLVTSGVIFATLSRPSAKMSLMGDDGSTYVTGISMLTISLLLTGVLGVLQEQTYKKHGPCWREGVFYTVSILPPWSTTDLKFVSNLQHLLSLPMFLFLGDDIRKGVNILKASSTYVIGLRWTYIVFTLNLLTQLICVSGVNQMTSVRSLFLFVTLRPP